MPAPDSHSDAPGDAVPGVAEAGEDVLDGVLSDEYEDEGVDYEPAGAEAGGGSGAGGQAAAAASPGVGTKRTRGGDGVKAEPRPKDGVADGACCPASVCCSPIACACGTAAR